jgi:hypothetical protein
MSGLLVVSRGSLQQQQISMISPSFSNRTNANSWALFVMSVDSRRLVKRSQYFLLFHTIHLHCRVTSSTRLLIVLSETGTVSISLPASLPVIVLLFYKLASLGFQQWREFSFFVQLTQQLNTLLLDTFH